MNIRVCMYIYIYIYVYIYIYTYRVKGPQCCVYPPDSFETGIILEATFSSMKAQDIDFRWSNVGLTRTQY